MAYNFTAQWTKGSNHCAPDALSCNPVMDPQTGDALAEYDNQNNPQVSTTEIRAITAADSPTDTRSQGLREKAVKDPEYQQLQTVILNGFPSHRQQLPEASRRFWNVREHLC